MRRATASLLLSGALLAGIAAPAAATAPVIVEMRTLSYAPAVVRLAAPGGTVRWSNVTSPDRLHDARSSLPDYFSGPLLSSGQHMDVTFSAAGTFTYICSIHDVMLGRVEVAPVVSVVDDGSGPRLRIMEGTQHLAADSPFRWVVFAQGPSDTRLRYRKTTRWAAARLSVGEPGTWTVMVRLRNRDAATSSSDSPSVTIDVPA